MTDFDYECLERKRLARQAQHRKCGAKSRKCPMSTDHMTHKQWKERCGAVVSISIGKPVHWETFKKMSKQIQEEYIKDLMDTYGANATSLAAMFGVRPRVVRNHIASNGLDITFQVGRSMSAEQRASWERFLKEEDALAHDTKATPANGVATEAEQHAPMSMSKLSLSFNGKIDVGMIANSLMQILGDDASGIIEINCYLA